MESIKYISLDLRIFFLSVDLEKITSKQLFSQNRDLEASLTVPPQKRQCRLCVTILPFQFLEKHDF